MPSNSLRIIAHHLYEYKKGVRQLILHTTGAAHQEAIENILRKKKVGYWIQKVNQKKINVFLGKSECIDIVRQMDFKSLSELTDEQDFMLGIMLGYDRLKQCRRYLRRKNGFLRK